jgi:hypothetical protein
MNTTDRSENLGGPERWLWRLVRLLVPGIYWSGIAFFACLVALTISAMVWMLAQPGELEAALCALGVCVIIVALVAVWVWAKMKRSEPNIRDELHGPKTK